MFKIVVYQESLEGIIDLQKLSGRRKLDKNPIISVTHFYDKIYKLTNDHILRFPSKTTFLHEEYINYKGFKDKILKAKTQITYNKYRFFTVEIDVKYASNN